MKKTLLACLAVATLLFIACSTQPSGHRAEDNLARTLLDSALLYIDRQDLQSAMLQLKKAEKLLPALENAKTKYQICQYIGWINETSGANELALHYQGLALDYAREYGKPELVVDVLINQANTLYNMGLNDSAWSITLEAARFYEQADRGQQSVIKRHGAYHEMLEGDLQKALEYQDLFTQNMMQADKEHASDNLQRLKAEYELKAQKSEMESLLRNRSLKLWLIIAAAVIALLVIVLIVRKKVSDHKLAVEQFRSQVERDQNRIHELVSDMENLIRTNDDLRRDRQTLSQKDLLMTSKIMGRNKVYTTAQSLGDQVTADTMNFALSDDDWADFISLTDLVYDGFSQRLLELYPKLGKWDVRICCLSKNGFSNQVISILLDTQTESYYRRKTRIKQMKMNLTDDTRTFEEIVNAV